MEILTIILAIPGLLLTGIVMIVLPIAIILDIRNVYKKFRG